MAIQNTPDSMLELFIYETSQLIEQLEEIIINSEKSGYYSQSSINDVFRTMHTIKGSSSMMMYESIASLAHSIEDLFYYLREEKPKNVDNTASII